MTTLVSGVVQRQAQALPVTSRPEATDRPLLKPGMQADEVVDLRLELNLAGADPALPMGTFFDQQVRSAVVAFQSSVGLVPDGHVGPKTWGALDFVARDRVPQADERNEMSARLTAALRAKRAGDILGAAAILRTLDRAGNIPPEVRPSFLFPLAECEHQLGDFQEATRLYLELVAAPTTDDDTRRNASQRLREARLRQPPGKLETEISGERREALKTAGGPEATDRPLLKPGMDAKEVVDLRLELNLAGAIPALSMGTLYDDRVRTAVLEFQRSAGLTPDGHVGPKTWGALDFIARDRIPDRTQRDETSARFNAGLALKRAGDLVGAAVIFRSLYSTPNIPPEVRPIFARALAECEHLLGNFDEAIGLYLEFAAAPALDDADRRIVSQRLREARLRQPPGKLEITISDERRQEFEREGRPEATDRPLLKPGMSAPEVVDLRLELNLAGANPAVPMGLFYDEPLRTAVLAFQRSAGLVTDGHVGPKTWGALDFIARDRIPDPAERDAFLATLTVAVRAKRAGDVVGAAALLRTLYRNPKLSPEVRTALRLPARRMRARTWELRRGNQPLPRAARCAPDRRHHPSRRFAAPARGTPPAAAGQARERDQQRAQADVQRASALARSRRPRDRPATVRAAATTALGPKLRQWPAWPPTTPSSLARSRTCASSSARSAASCVPSPAARGSSPCWTRSSRLRSGSAGPTTAHSGCSRTASCTWWPTTARPEGGEYDSEHPHALDRTTAAGRAALERRPVHIPDIRADPEYTYPGPPVLPLDARRTDHGRGRADRRGRRSSAASRKPFTDEHIELVQTFADQAAIAITNARLIEAVERQRTELARFVSPQVAELISSRGWRAAPGRTPRLHLVPLLRPARLHRLRRDGRARGAVRRPPRVPRRARRAHPGVRRTLEHFAGDGVMVFFNDPLAGRGPRASGGPAGARRTGAVRRARPRAGESAEPSSGSESASRPATRRSAGSASRAATTTARSGR